MKLSRFFVTICLLPFITLSVFAEQLIANKIYTHAQVWTGAMGQPLAEAIAVSGERIVAIGANTDIYQYADDTTEVIDLGGAFVVPGFVDNHVHFLTGGFDLASVSLRSAQTPTEFTQRLAAHALKSPKGRWILGGNWDHELWGGTLPTKQWIDSVTPNNPVLVRRLDGHMALANTVALKRAGVTRDTVAPEGGVIVRDEKGEPTGVLKDTAITLIAAVIPPVSEEELDQAFQAASAAALKHGITQVHDMGLGEGKHKSWTSLNTYLRAQKNDSMNLRVYSFLPLTEWQNLAKFVENEGRGDNWLRWGALKGFLDGSLGSATAWFYDAYINDPNNTGFAVMAPKKIKKMVKGADAAGLHVAVHAIGDRANDTLLKIFEEVAQENGARDRRFRIEHSQHLTLASLPRFKALNVIPSMQPYHAIDDGRWAENSIGAERITRTYAFKSLLEAGAPLTFGSDWFVAPLSPLEGIYAAVTRRTIDGKNPTGWVPQERITVEEALQAYTQANAYAGFMEVDTGTLVAGKLADFTVLSDNLFTIDPVTIPAVQVLRTVVGGKDQFVKDSLYFE